MAASGIAFDGGQQTVGDVQVLLSGDAVELRRRALSTLAAAHMAVAPVSARSGAPSVTELEATDLAVVCSDVAAPTQTTRLRQLRAEFKDTAVVMVCSPPGPIGVRRVLDAGIEGLVFSETLEDVLSPTVSAVLAGQIVVPRSARQQLERPALTSREKQVLGMVTLGFANGEIASKLYLAESTVKSHLSSAFAKLGVRSRSEATMLILDPKGPLGPGILRISGDGADAETT